MESLRPLSGLRTLARAGILVATLTGCSSEGSGDRGASLDAALRDDASARPGDDDAGSEPGDDERDAEPADEPDADDLEPDAGDATDGASEGDGSEQVPDDAATSDGSSPDDAGTPDAGASDPDAQTTDAGPTCGQGLADCNGDDADGCEVDTTSSAQHCSGCGQACSVGNAVPMCVASSCMVASCLPSFGDCNGDASDGCEVSTASSLQHCGGCNRPCAPRANASTVCFSGGCALGACTSGFANCNGNAADGCEVNVNNDPRHCGGCGLACGLANASPGCTAQRCTIAACNPGFSDCNGVANDGCEIDTRSNRNHCGGCDQPCAAGLRCVQSSCQP